MINLLQVDDGLRAVKVASEPIANQLDQAETIRRGVFEALEPYSKQFGHFHVDEVSTLIPEATRLTLVDRLDEAIKLQGAAATGIDDAFGAGSWMASSSRQNAGFLGEARRIIHDPVLGPDTADQALHLLRRNGFASDEAIRVLRTGDTHAMLNPFIAREIDVADDVAFLSPWNHS